MQPDIDSDAPSVGVRRTTPRHAAVTAKADRRVVGVILALVIAAVLAAVVLWPTDRAPERPASGSAAGEPAWQQHVAGLYDVRAEAFRNGDADLLAQVYTKDSRQLRADLETIESLVAQDRTVVGFAPALLEVVSVAESADAVVVVVRDKIEPFSIVDPTGTRMPVAGRAPAQATLTLHHSGGAWLIALAERAAQ